MLCRSTYDEWLKTILAIRDRLRDDIAKKIGFVETHLGHYTGNQWREFFRMMPSTAESLLREIAPFLVEGENCKDVWMLLFKLQLVVH